YPVIVTTCVPARSGAARPFPSISISDLGHARPDLTMEAKLIVTGGKANRSEVKLKLPSIIGRGSETDLRVNHPSVSRKHCEISELEGALVVRDLGSTNGTF